MDSSEPRAQGADALATTDDGAALRAVERMRWRIRIVRAARGAIELALYAVAFAVLILLAGKLGRVSEPSARRMLAATLVLPAIGIAVGLARRVPALMAAQMLDRAYDFKDRLANALEFRSKPAAERTPMMDAAVTDASHRARAHRLDATRALAWRWPSESGYVLALGAMLAIVALVEIRTRVVITHAQPPVVVRDPLQLSDDDVQAFRDFARQMEQRAATDSSRDAVHRFDQFVNQLSDRQLDRQEAFRRLQQLQEDLERNGEDDRAALRDALRDLGSRMDANDTTRPLAEALRAPDADAAARAMHQLAESLRQNAVSPDQRQQLQQALQHALDHHDDQDREERLRRAREEVERMLRQQRERQLSESEQRNLQQRQRELEHLQRDQQHREAERRQLQRLERQMSQAMQDLARDVARAAQDMEQGAQDLNHMSNEELSQEQIADLRQQLEDLRQRMRQQNGQGGEQQRMRLQRFAGQARGGVMPGGMEPGGSHGRLRLALGGGGRGIPIPGGVQSGQGANGEPQQQGNEPGGVQAGTQHDEHIRGASTSIETRNRTVAVQGQQRGNGTIRPQIIRTAAQEGFTVDGYRDVHAAYWEHAQQVVHAGDVPPGYRSYVRRYFQLIRPRDE